MNVMLDGMPTLSMRGGRRGLAVIFDQGKVTRAQFGGASVVAAPANRAELAATGPLRGEISSGAGQLITSP
jgi:hypothetical protein